MLVLSSQQCSVCFSSARIVCLPSELIFTATGFTDRSLLSGVEIILTDVLQDSEDSFVWGEPAMLFSLCAFSDVERAKDKQPYGLVWRKKYRTRLLTARYISTVYFWKLERMSLTLQERWIFSSLSLFNLCVQFFKLVHLRRLAQLLT